MSYFSNRDINYLNVHYMLRGVGWEMSNVFTLAYLYKQGLPLWAVFGNSMLLFALRYATRPLAMKFAFKFGLKRTLVLGTVFFALRYLFLIPITSLNGWMVAYSLCAALSENFYFLIYHTFFAVIGEGEQRGHHLGLREALNAGATVMGPLLCGFLLATFGGIAAFGGAAVVTFCSLIPLSAIKSDKYIEPLPKDEKKKISRFGFNTYFGDGIMYGANAAWPIIVFMMLGENYGNFGLIFALAAFFRAVNSLLLGKMLDKGYGRNLYVIVGILMAIVPIGRFFANSIPFVIFCDFAWAMTMSIYVPTLMTGVYNAMKESRHPLYFSYYAEVGWDFGGILGLAVCITLASLGYNLRFALFAVSLGGLTVGWFMRQYYKEKSKT